MYIKGSLLLREGKGGKDPWYLLTPLI